MAGRESCLLSGLNSSEKDREMVETGGWMRREEEAKKKEEEKGEEEKDIQTENTL